MTGKEEVPPTKNHSYIESEFILMIVVADRHAGERTFTAEELRSSVVDTLSDLHLEVTGIKVITPIYTHCDEKKAQGLSSPVPGSNANGHAQPNTENQP